MTITRINPVQDVLQTHRECKTISSPAEPVHMTVMEGLEASVGFEKNAEWSPHVFS